MQYTSSRAFDGDFDKSVDLAVAALTALGFRLESRTADSVRLKGPGMNSNRQNALLGASRLDINLRQGQLDLAADLGAADRLMQFVKVFPISISCGLGLALLAGFAITFAGWAPVFLWIIPVVAITLLNVVLWAILGPRIARSIHQRTCRGLDTLLNTMVVTGQQSSANTAMTP